MNATVAMLAALVVSGPQDLDTAQDRSVSYLKVTLIDDVDIAAKEDGILTALSAKLGDVVTKDGVMGRVDDRDAQVRLKAAEYELEAASEQAKSRARVESAVATVGVAKAEHEQMVAINKGYTNAVSDFEIRRLDLTHIRSKHQLAVEELEFFIAGVTENIRRTAMQAVENEIKRRRIESPLDGVVIKRYRDVGEWVRAGDPVYRVVRMDRLRVEGLLEADKYESTAVDGMPVKIVVHLANNKTTTINSTITFASPVVDAAGTFVVQAEFDNPKSADGYWIVRPGSRAEMVLTQ